MQCQIAVIRGCFVLLCMILTLQRCKNHFGLKFYTEILLNDREKSIKFFRTCAASNLRELLTRIFFYCFNVDLSLENLKLSNENQHLSMENRRDFGRNVAYEGRHMGGTHRSGKCKNAS